VADVTRDEKGLCFFQLTQLFVAPVEHSLLRQHNFERSILLKQIITWRPCDTLSCDADRWWITVACLYNHRLSARRNSSS